MKKQMTINQHYVPQHYMKLWADTSGKVWLHDLAHNIKGKVGTKSVLSDEYFYEDDKNKPTNEIEDILGEIENKAAPVLKAIAELKPDELLKNEMDIHKEICQRAALVLAKAGALEKLLNFISAQLIRTPNIVQQMAKIIKEAPLSSEEREIFTMQNEPSQLVRLGLERIPRHLQSSYEVVLGFSSDTPFVTSDHPVSEFFTSTAEVLPQPVYNLLHETQIMVLFPISPTFHCTLIHRDNKQRLGTPYHSRELSSDSLNGLPISWMWIDEALIYFFRGMHSRFGRKHMISNRDEAALLNN
ncbi:hypothetical protein ASE80_21380 [Pseudomonas sp. Leaf15]|uniref:DUF4238 domain-containing protein n=1 Tax=unclassified Pseudomonas TaxID=196821 RepID=UPI0007031A44|nr:MULTISPECIES: DUF4238 domain-containing protein [unclassified Pseudomonas]KQM54573.1 hypothetical protein ASE80_21380 [Pseudomonas sp. Leaf15]RAH00518.1 DUF4238 domain-containing protein [Pseudomonas sp. Leaf98]